MKTLFIFLMAIAAINAFFIGDKSRDELAQEMEKVFSNFRNFGHDGKIPIPQASPVKFSELIKTIEKWIALSEEERNAMRNHLFGVKFPRPTPAHQIEKDHRFFDEEKMKEMREKWESLTPEECDEIFHRRREHHEGLEGLIPDDRVVIHRVPKPDHHQKPQPYVTEEKLKEIHEKWEAMTPEERDEVRNNRRKHLNDEFSKNVEVLIPDDTNEIIVDRSHFRRTHLTDEKIKEMQEKWEAMTPEEREKILQARTEFYENFEFLTPEEKEALILRNFFHRSPRVMAAHHVKNHPHLNEEEMLEKRQKWEAMTQEEREEIKNKHHRSARSIQMIKPLPEKIDRRPNIRPNFPRNDELFASPRTIELPRPLPELERPSIRPAMDNGRTRIVDPMARDRVAVPLPEITRPIRPIGRSQPIRPLPEVQRPVRPASDNGRTRPVNPLERDRNVAPLPEITRPIRPRNINFNENLPKIYPGKPLPVDPQIDEIWNKMDKMTQEERLQFIKDLFPNGIPIRPIGVVPAENNGVEVLVEEDDDEIQIQPANIYDAPRPMPDGINFPKPEKPLPFPKPEKPLPLSKQINPILPIERQPILPRQINPILPIQRQPILPIERQPILPRQFQPIIPLERQPILPNQRQPILPMERQPILPLPFKKQ